MSRVLILLLRSHLRVLCGVASSKVNCDVRQFMFSQVATPRAAIREGDTTQGLSFMNSDLNQEPPLSKKLANSVCGYLHTNGAATSPGPLDHVERTAWLLSSMFSTVFFFFYWVEIFSARKTHNGRDLRAVVLKLSKQGLSITFLPLEPIFEYLFFKKKHKWTAMLHVL